MIDYLRAFNVTDDEISKLKSTLSSDTIANLEVMRYSVTEALKFLKSFGVNNLFNVIIHRPDLLFRTKSDLEDDLSAIDKNLILYVIENDIDDLINFNI